MSKFLEIAHGWYNYINSSPSVQLLAEDRIKECDDCPERGEMSFVAAAIISLVGPGVHESRPLYQCNKCGCPLSAKVMSPESKCPLGKW